MPKEIEKKLIKGAKKLGLTGKRKGAYVYGTINKIEMMMKKPKKMGNPGNKMKDNMGKNDMSIDKMKKEKMDMKEKEMMMKKQEMEDMVKKMKKKKMMMKEKNMNMM